MVVTDSNGNSDSVIIRLLISSATSTSPITVVADLLETDFENIDLDGDGMLTRLEVGQRFPNITDGQFAEMDNDGDGRLTPEELAAVAEPVPIFQCNTSIGNLKSFKDTMIEALVTAIHKGLVQLW